ncbi:MAG: hypothetical protein Q7R22_000780 [Verrucomicrobiota bacterium JB025]|nr:hypothetical protein [Verrucomicrobiota bacterium JB025]
MGDFEADAVDGFQFAEGAVEVADFEGGHGWERGGRRSEGRRVEESKSRRVEGRRSKVEGRRSKSGRVEESKVEGRRSKVEGRRSKVEGRRSKVEEWESGRVGEWRGGLGGFVI